MVKKKGKKAAPRNMGEAAPKKKVSWLDYLLVFVPISIVLHFTVDDPLVIFGTVAMGIIPLAGLMGRATEEIARHTSAAVGGFLNATFGNATELIIAIVAIKEAAANPAAREALHIIVKASITGSIIGNILLVFGLSILLGGLKHRVQRFNVRAAQMSSSIMTLAVIGLLIPSMWGWFPTFGNESEESVQLVSDGVAIVLIILYLLSLVFSLNTHKDLLTSPKKEDRADHDHMKNGAWSKEYAIGMLIITAVLVALMSELLVGSIDGATKTLGLTELFVGVIIIAIVGNAAEHSTAILMALRNKVDISLTIATGSSAQIAMLVTPLVLFTSLIIGGPMTLVFYPFEVVAMFISVVVLNMVSIDGESNWFEGCMLLGVYAILGIMFYFHPPL